MFIPEYRKESTITVKDWIAQYGANCIKIYLNGKIFYDEDTDYPIDINERLKHKNNGNLIVKEAKIEVVDFHHIIMDIITKEKEK